MDIYGDGPVPILLSASVENSTATKAALKEWNDTEINVFGLKREADGYDFDDPFNIFDRKARVSSDGAVTLEGEYSYAEGYVYDFYGYYLGGAKATSVKKDAFSYSFEVTLDGSNDLLYATTDRSEDLKAYDGNDPLAESHLYSAIAARRGVQPTLHFSHALSRFNFIVQGKGNNSPNFEIRGLEIKAICSGTLFLGMDKVAFEPAKDVQPGAVALKDEDADTFSPVMVKMDQDIHLGGENAAIMVAPGSKNIDVLMKLHSDLDDKDYDYEFTVHSSDIELPDGKKSSETFLEGYSYDIKIIVYGLERIEINSSVDSWIETDDFEIDPDDYYEPPTPIPPKDEDIGNDVIVDDYDDGGSLGNQDL